jgi:hypothetical protein
MKTNGNTLAGMIGSPWTKREIAGARGGATTRTDDDEAMVPSFIQLDGSRAGTAASRPEDRATNP